MRALKADDPALIRRNARKLLEATNKLHINVMNEPRPGKKLLVLDLDYTILVSSSRIARTLLWAYGLVQDSEDFVTVRRVPHRQRQRVM